MEDNSEEIQLLGSPEDIYSTSEHNQKLSYFYNSNRIISSPAHVKLFFKHFQHYSIDRQEKMLRQILVALRTVSTNSYLLNEQSKGKRRLPSELTQNFSSQKHLLTLIVDLLMSSVGNYLIFNLLFQVYEELLPCSQLEDMLLYQAISKLTIGFYDSRVHAAQLFAATTILKGYFNAKILAERDPNNMLVFHGGNNIDIISLGPKHLPWILKEGFTLIFWINLQNIKSSVEASLPKLFTFYSTDSGGVESYLIDNKVYYRIIGPKYTQPQIGSNGIFLGEIDCKKWNFIAFQHEGHHTFQKSKLKFYINTNKPIIFGLDPPKISSSSNTKYIFFDKIYCKTSSVCLFPSLIGQEGIDQFNKNINSIESIKNPKAYVFQSRQGKVYERSGLGASHNYIFERNLDINFQLVLPLFYLLRFQQKDQQYPTLDQLLEVFAIFLRQSAYNQMQANKNGYFKTISELICEVPNNIFQESTIKSIVYIKHTITDTNILDQYFSDFLWPLLYANISIARKEQILETVKNTFTQNIAHYSTQIGLDEMINLLQKLQGGSLTCCEKHFKIASNKFQRTLMEGQQIIFGEEKKAQSYIFALIESTLQNSKLQFPQEIYKLCRLLCLKCSPCFILELMSLIRKLLTQKFTERMSEHQTKQIIKYFQEKKVHFLFIHLIQNQFFAQIKAESVKLIYSLLIKRSSNDQEHISHLISKSLWKINEFAEDQSSPSSLKNISPPPIQEELDRLPPLNITQKEFKPPAIQEIQQEQDNIFSLVGPQAPALSNRLKGKKSFDFGFVNQSKKPKQSEQIMEEQKTTEPSEPISFSEPIISKLPQKKEKKSFLSINTEAINEMYTFGGEKGQQIIISEDEQQMELDKIIQLAQKCVKTMKGNHQMEQQEVRRNIYVPPPMTTTNKAAAKKKTFNLRLIEEEEESVPVKVPTPLATKKSNKTPTSIKSSNEENLFTLYNSLLESCLGVSFQTCLISNSKVQVPSILSIFFKWIPQTDLQTKFLNDLDIILQCSQNMALIIELPQLYDFLFQLCYKCLLFEEMKQKRIYTQKLENIIKVIFNYIFREDLAGFSKFSFILNWVDQKKNQHYEPKCLFLTSRYVVLLILECIEELLLMNNSNNPIMERNFQSLATVLDTLKKIIPDDYEELNIDNYDRVVFTSDFELPTSLIPYFKSDWADFILYQKYLFIFKRFYYTDWYIKGLKNLSSKENQFLDFLMQAKKEDLQKQAGYYLRNNFLVSLIEIQRAMLLEMQHTQSTEAEDCGEQAIWQTVLLVTLVEINKEKTIKSQRSEIILAFLKSCKLLAEKGIERIVEIVPMLSTIKHYLSISSAQSSQKPQASTVILDDIISNYIPQYLLNMGKTDLESFIRNFSDVWIPKENQYKKIHSDLFVSDRQKLKKEKDFNFIQFISNILEEQNERKEYTDVILQANSRSIRNNYRKLWYNLRVYNQLWTHPRFKCQQDTLFNKSLYSYEKYQNSAFFKYKVAKQTSKGKGRFFLKLQLLEPSFVEKDNYEQQQRHHIEYNLEKALTVMNDKLMIGPSKKGWIVGKGEDALNFSMQFKKIRIINTLTTRSGYLAIASDNLIFISSKSTEYNSHLAIDQYQIRQDKSLHKSWPLQYIKEIHKRRYVNKKKSVLVYFIYGKSVVFDFASQEDSEEFLKKITKLKHKCVNLAFIGKPLDPRKLIESLDYGKKWASYELSTFDYLMEINTISGRAYSDLTQYPVFPWTLINFEDSKPNLNDQKQIRDLTLPMGANGSQDRIHNFQERYQIMHIDDEHASKFHYGTHYSSPGIIYHFLVRLSPYTEGSVLLQSGKFDFADRLFCSFGDSYKNATSEYSDVRELIPELYSIPEAYLNINGLDFGVMQSKKRVHNIELPDWARENPYLFVYNMRKCLQEETVSKSISNWIDLIFGYKQKGEEAARALNCFYYLTYQDAVPWQKITSEKDVQSIQSQIVNFGQTPSQIFMKPHHERYVLSGVKNFKMICDAEAQLRVYRPTKNNKQMTEDDPILNPFKQPDESIIYMKWVSESKVVFIRKSGDVIFYKCSPNTNPASKVPFQCTVEKQKKIDRLKKNVFDPNQFYDLSLEVQNFPIQLIGSSHTLCLGGLSDGKLSLIDIDTGTNTNTYNNHSYTISCLRSDNMRENFLVTGDIKGNVILWEIKTSNSVSKLTLKKMFRDQKEQITSIFFSSELQCFAVASLDGSVFLYNAITGKKIRAFYHPKRAPINQVVLTANPLAAILLFCNSDNTIYSYSINGQLIARSHEKMFSTFLSPIIVKDSKLFEYVVFGNQKSQVQVKTLPFLQAPPKSIFKVAKGVCVNKICLSKHSRFLVTGCSDGELTIITDPNMIPNS